MRLLSSACAVCGRPVRIGKGELYFLPGEIYSLHAGECMARFGEAVEKAIAHLRLEAEARRRGVGARNHDERDLQVR